MRGVNKQILAGHLGQNPTVAKTQQGQKVVSFSLATSEQWTDKATGEKKESTAWHKIVIFNEPLAEIAEKYLKKGSPVYVEGQSLSRKYVGKDGVERTVTECVIRPFKGELVLLARAEGAKPDADAYGGTSADPPPFDDAIPF